MMIMIRMMIRAMVARNLNQIEYQVVRFPNWLDSQLGFQYPKKWEIGKQWLILEKNCTTALTYWGKLTSYMSHESISARKNSQSVTVAELEDQTCHPPNPHFSWRPFSQVGFVHKMILYLRQLCFLISSQSSFQLEAIFASWICSKGRNSRICWFAFTHICASLYFWFVSLVYFHFQSYFAESTLFKLY